MFCTCLNTVPVMCQNHPNIPGAVLCRCSPSISGLLIWRADWATCPKLQFTPASPQHKQCSGDGMNIDGYGITDDPQRFSSELNITVTCNNINSTCFRGILNCVVNSDNASTDIGSVMLSGN